MTDLNAKESPVPKDFEVVAQYEPRHSPWNPWVLIISGNGAARRRVGSEPKETPLAALSPQQVAALKKEIDRARFVDLKENYTDPVTDNPTLTLAVTQNGKKHSTSVYAPLRLKGNSDVKRFLSVWRQVLTLVPSPNPGDTADRYNP